MTEMPNMPVPEILFIIDSDVFCVCVRLVKNRGVSWLVRIWQDILWGSWLLG